VVMSSSSCWGTAWQFTLIYVLLVLVVGAALFWIIRNFVRNMRLANLLTILVVLLCLAVVLRQMLLLFGVGA
jgi:hypothetical protein